MYAFVAVDTETGEFLAARDPFGVKPLYLIQSQSAQGFLFCSEISPLLKATETGDVLLLPPGHVMTRNFCGPHFKLPSAKSGKASSPQQLDRIVSEAVRTRVPSDLPLAALFSGGLDSTLVVHYARRFQPNISCYIAVGRSGPDHEYAKRYADDTGLDLREVEFNVTRAGVLSLADAVVEVVEAFEPAVIRPSLHTYLLSQRIHQDGFRVALCGEGADELFAGYEPLEEAFTHAKALGRDVRNQCLAMMHRANLQRIDRCSMRFQVEIREPFLDQSVVRFAYDLDESILLNRLGNSMVGKAPLRALYDLHPSELPREIRDREKMLFHYGAGADVEGALWFDLFETVVSNAEFYEGRREYCDFAIGSKEELYYLRALSEKLDVRRIPHLRDRLRLQMPRAA
jgi:asparagine synthase (glutamine-hydrolysing)